MSAKTTATHTLLLAAGATLVMLVSESALLPQLAIAAGASRCATPPKPEALRRLLSAPRREQFAKDTLQVITAELDGAPPREAVAFADHAPSEYDAALPRESVLWVFRCMDARWQQVAEHSYDIGDVQYGEDEEYGRPGFKNVTAERLLLDRDLLLIEWFNFNNNYLSDYRTFDLYALRSNELVPVFSCATLERSSYGPRRQWGGSTERSIEFLKDPPPARILVTIDSQQSPDVDDEDAPLVVDSRTEIYRYDGTKFVTYRPACDGM